MFGQTDAERRKAQEIRRRIGFEGGEEQEEEVIAAVLKDAGLTPSGRRRRDARGCVIRKPHAPENARQAESNEGPRRDPDGKRIDKPFQPRR